jgi:glycosyltransferase involved in cell wall biosynthesis
MTDGLRVAHVVLSLDLGGLERIVVNLAREGLQRGQQCAVICLERSGALAKQAEQFGAEVHCVHKRPGLRPGTVSRVKEVLRGFRPDVVHTHTPGGLLYAGRAARAMGVPLVVHTEHLNNTRHPSIRPLVRWRRTWLLWYAAGYCRRFFCVSKDIAVDLAAQRVVPRPKLAVLLNGIDTEHVARATDTEALRRSLQIPAGAPVIGTVGRLNTVKRQDLLIRAFARVRQRFPQAHLVLVGDGPARDTLNTLVAQLQLQASVHLVGAQLEPERYLQIMDVFALSSSLEGLPLAILEAWAVGLPVIASAVGGVPDLIADGRNGLLFEPGDEAVLARLLGELLENPTRGSCLGREGQREVNERYGLRRMALDYEAQYAELLRHGVYANSSRQ